MNTRTRPSSAASPKPRQLRRRKPSLAARVRPFWIVGIVLAVLTGWAAFALAESPWFRIAHVGIDVPIGSPVSRDQVRRAAAIAPDANLWLLRTHAIARRLEAIPYVDAASVHRGQFPQPFVEIAVSVRRPTACVRAGGRLVTIDRTARVLQDGCADAQLARLDAGAARVPPPGGTIGDPAVGRLLDDVKVLADANLAVRQIGRDRWGGLQAVDVTGVTLRFGEDEDLAKKAALVEPVRAGLGTHRAVRAIDLRAPGAPTVEFR